MLGKWDNLSTCNLFIGLLSKLDEFRIEAWPREKAVREGLSLVRASGWDQKKAARKPQEEPFQTRGGSGPGEQEPGGDQGSGQLQGTRTIILSTGILLNVILI